jgi:hypothetical protein
MLTAASNPMPELAPVISTIFPVTRFLLAAAPDGSLRQRLRSAALAQGTAKKLRDRQVIAEIRGMIVASAVERGLAERLLKGGRDGGRNEEVDRGVGRLA